MKERRSFREALTDRLDLSSGTPVTVVVWLIASAAVIYLLAGRAQSFEYVGVARSLRARFLHPLRRD